MCVCILYCNRTILFGIIYINILDYLYESTTFWENVMWISNAGYVSFEIMEIGFNGASYFLQVSNYFDMLIIVNWVAIGFLRFVSQHVFRPERIKSGNELETRNKFIVEVYMALFGLQVIVLYSRIALLFTRSRTLGPFIRMIGGMIDDVIKFAFVAAIFCFGFWLAIYFVAYEDINTDCGADTNEYDTLTGIGFYVFQTLLSQQEWVHIEGNDCLSGERSRIIQMFVSVFSVLGTILLLNLLIAMMASTVK